MTSDRLRTIERLFHETRERPGPERDAFLAAACGGDSALRREVQSLLAQDAGGLIDAGVAVLAAAVVDRPPRLAPGTSLGPNRIDCLIDTGGMGEVYRARDTVLGRDVAIKILPREFTADPDRLVRFEREARLLAALNHPHIAAIYGVADGDGVRGLVLELIEGPTLAERLAGEPLPLKDVLRLAGEMADALEAAHEKGVVHRDLKPSNIKLTSRGAAKVIDFGLGKTIESAGSSTMTETGAILGTAAYMSPEQARGRPVDKRTDIWSFGCVLYEMLAWRSAFGAETVSDALVAILEREPNWNALPAATPDAIRRLLRRCLQKDPSERLHDIADARIEIAEAVSGPGETARAASPPDSRRRRAGWMGIGGAALVVYVALVVATLYKRPASGSRLLEFRVQVADNTGFGVAMSPDGRHLAYGVCCGGPEIWVHDFDSGADRAIPGTELGGFPFWSPDSSTLGFVTAARELKRVPLAGGPPVTIARLPDIGTATWSAGDVILVSARRVLLRVPAKGGAPSELTINDGESQLATRSSPSFLPDTRHFIYHVSGRLGGSVRLGSLDSTETRELVASDYPAVFAAPSYILFLRATALMAQMLNPRTLELEGNAVVLESDVAPGFLGELARVPVVSAAASGVVAIVKTRNGSAGQLTWFDRSGRPTGTIQPPEGGEYLNPVLSPDGERLAVNRMDPVTGNWDIWIIDLARGVSSRLTNDAASDADPVWSPDGKSIAFASNRGGRFGIYRKTVDGGDAEESVLKFEEGIVDVSPSDWSPDGRNIAFNVTGFPLPVCSVELGGRHAVKPMVTTPLRQNDVRFSPDGRWIAYGSYETGPTEIYLQRLEPPGEKILVSKGGGTHARWVSGGRELVYWAFPGGIKSVDLDLSRPRVRIGEPKTLVSNPVLSLMDSRTQFDVTRDGQRFLVRQPAGIQGPSVTVIVNWTERLKR